MKHFQRIFAGCLLLASLTVAAMLAAVPPKNEMVKIKSGDEMINGFLALPEGSGRHPGIVVIHDWIGLNDWAKAQAEKLAGKGYVALAVDLYRGKVAANMQEASEMMKGLPEDRAVRDLVANFNFLAARPDVDKNKIGSIGWCMGGTYSFLLAVNEPKLAAAVVNYGAPPTDEASIKAIKAPILGNFGGDDRGIRPEAVKAFAEAANADGKSFDYKIYDGAPHGFENETSPASYRPEATADAWNRIDAFYAKNLKGK